MFKMDGHSRSKYPLRLDIAEPVGEEADSLSGVI